jgi:hypothetical protein
MANASTKSLTTYDARLVKEGVAFLPWIGEEYEKGWHGRKVLVLGESHYSTWTDADRERREHSCGPTFTRECVDEVVRRVDGARLFRSLEQALLNEERLDGWAPNGGSPLWSRLAFYNFVQSPVDGGARVSPTSRQFQESFGAFKAVIDAIAPQRVIVCGMRLWGQMPSDILQSDNLHSRVQAYRLLSGQAVWCLAIHHPSSAFSWKRWHGEIIEFLKSPEDAATLAARSG